MSLNIYSPAKVNLRLEVLRKRCDSYHDIVSLIQPIALYDEISIEVEEGNSIEVDMPKFPELKGQSNLAYRAAEFFFAETGLKACASISIDKSIPVAAGLGGGSSNAATVLKGLNSIFDTPIPQKRLMEMGKEIGADVPFFLWGSAAIVQGIGEVIEGIYLPEIWYLIVDLRFPVSTGSVYKGLNLDLTKKGVGINIRHLKRSLKDALTIKEILYNDLEQTVCIRHPELMDVKRLLVDSGALGSLVTGSGPTVFGIFQNKRDVEKTYNLLMDDVTRRGWSLYLVRSIN
ncbi:MAG: 4-(cytidine 5'-diphospho)-2-C-methyl-D-erythritol kinase [Thermodesulfobacteriota bacterium]